ncbi:hypothetical protein QQA05_09670 [Corynebacterium macclintockiae]|uniref:hypothetical protein n=1 Tax=Corynebacterium macclintockiae TaxID=2913501 RepID=UPI00254D5FE6|nr:hypothetical protein [Corynebacterium macclintockiae]MDK8891659.1 hypothetical protein [Corynebacterium macclintockiae]
MKKSEAKHRKPVDRSWVQGLLTIFFGAKPLSKIWTAVLILAGIGVSAFVAIKRSSFLSDEFENDARLILKFARGETDEGGSFRTIATLYNNLHLDDNATLAGLFGVGLGALLAIIVILRAGGIRRNIISVSVLLFYLAFSGVFFGTYTKEIIVLMVLIIMASLASTWYVESVLIGMIVLVGVTFRPYWVFLAAAYLFFRLIPFKYMKVRILLPLMFVVNFGFSLAIWYGANKPGDFFRTSVNLPRVDTGEAATIIVRYISDIPEPLGGAVNNAITLAGLIFPFPLIALFKPYYLAITLVFFLIWIAFFVAVKTRTSEEKALTARAIALFVSFVAVQGLFEPDYGSALRHLTPFIPFILLVWRPRNDDSPNAGAEMDSEASLAETSGDEDTEYSTGAGVLSLTPVAKDGEKPTPDENSITDDSDKESGE